jgi:hypothetical protein
MPTMRLRRNLRLYDNQPVETSQPVHETLGGVAKPA